MIGNLVRGLALVLFVAIAAMAGEAGAAELKLLSVEAMKPALQELAPAFEASAKHKLKVEYASAADIEKKVSAAEEYDVVVVDDAITKKLAAGAKVAGGLIKQVAKHDNLVYAVSTTNWTDKPLEAKALVDFLAGPKAADVYKAKGLQKPS
jgi:ABC-type molybdate transport system substrate-binding protein